MRPLLIVEGNSRLAAYRLLAEENAIQWGRVKCAILPKEVNDSAIASLLGQLHLKGKKDWRPYEQASFLHRRHYKDKISITNLAKEVPLKKRGIEHRIAVIDYMIKHKGMRFRACSAATSDKRGCSIGLKLCPPSGGPCKDANEVVVFGAGG